MPRNGKDVVTDKSRRRLLGTIGSAGILGIAGCIGGDDEETPASGDDGNGDPGGNGDSDGNGDDSDDTPEPGGEPVDDSWTTTTNPTATYIGEIGFNPFNPDVNSTLAAQFLYESDFDLNMAEGELEPRVIEGYEINGDGTEVTVQVNADDYGWENGDPITAQDLYANRVLAIATGAEPDIEDVQYVDEGEYVLDLGDEPMNPSIFETQALGVGINAPYSYYGEYVEQLEDASSEDEEDEVLADLREDPMEQEDFLASGPFKIEQITEQELILEKNEHNPVSEDINFPNINLLRVQSEDALTSLVQSGRVDGLWHSFGRSFIDGVRAAYDVWIDESYGGNGWFFNLGDDVVGKRAVRQAIMHVLNIEQMVHGADTINTPVKYVTGMPNNTSERWLGEGWIDENLTDYNLQGNNTEEAEEVLRQADFTKEDGQWYMPDGEELILRPRTQGGHTVRVRETQIAVEQLSDFGIETEIEVLDAATHWSRLHDRDFTIHMGFYGQRGFPHPYEDFMSLYFGENFDLTLGYGENWLNQTDVIEAPMPVGDPNGSLEEYPQRDRIEELKTTQDPDREEEIIKELAWVYNQNVWGIPIDVRSLPILFSTENWHLPDGEEYMDQYDGVPFAHLMRTASIQARTE